MAKYCKILTGTIVVSIEQGKECADAEDIVVLCEARHYVGRRLQARRCVV